MASNFSDLILGCLKSDTDVPSDVNIVDFVHAPWGLNADGRLKLWPVQQVILKAHYGVPLDDRERFDVTSWDRKPKYRMTEREYLKFLFEEGRCNIGEVDHERRELVLSIGRRSGKCVTGDTLIFTDQGARRIGEVFPGNTVEVLPYQAVVAQEGAHRLARSAYFYTGGVKPIRRVLSASGYHISGTLNHRVRVMTEGGVVEWKELGNIQPGDFLCIHTGADLWSLKDQELPSGEPLTIELAELLGVAQAQRQMVVKPLGASPECEDPLGDLPKASRVPDVILQSTKPLVLAYLRGLFGRAHLKWRARSFEVRSRAGVLLSEIQILLTNLGVFSRRSMDPKNLQWRLVVEGPYCVKFFEEVGWSFQAGEAAQKVALMADAPDTSEVPYQVPWLLWLMHTGPKHLRRSLAAEVRLDHLNAASGKPIHTPRPFTRRALDRLMRFLKHFGGFAREYTEHFETLASTPYVYDPVISVVEDEAPVFDLSVPQGHSFVGNGLTNHNTFITSAIIAFELYRLLTKGDPQAFYGMPPNAQMQLISVAPDKDIASLLYSAAMNHFKNCAFFAQYAANLTQSYARFQTPQDVAKYGRYVQGLRGQSTLASIRILFKRANGAGLRGGANIFVAMDEAAHLLERGLGAAEDVYNALTPSTATFNPKDPVTGRGRRDPITDRPLASEGRVILISTPLGRDGFFYKLYQLGMEAGPHSSNMLCVQAPTWEVNPDLSESELMKHYYKDATVFFTEYGAVFSDRTRGWIESENDLLACVDPEAKPILKGVPRRPYFMGIDFALKTDATAVAIGHIDPETDEIVLDYLDQIKAGEGRYVGLTRLSPELIADWILDLSKRFYILDGMFDQWLGDVFEQYLDKRGLTQCRMVPMTAQLKTDICKNFKTLMWERRIKLYDTPTDKPGTHCEYIQELLTLQVTVKSKWIQEVEAPKGKHDDRSDALFRMVWLATQAQSARRKKGGGKAPPVTLMSGGASLGDGRIRGVIPARMPGLQSSSRAGRVGVPPQASWVNRQLQAFQSGRRKQLPGALPPRPTR